MNTNQLFSQKDESKSQEEEQQRFTTSSSPEPLVDDWSHQLNIFVERERLQQDWQQSIPKRRACFYNYEQCKQWVCAQNMWETKAEWENWIDQGEKCNCMVPSDPEAHYTERGTWTPWVDFLGLLQ
eukprot:CAMPEP_0198114652 /NCGR_PEP_ID=MMETSP1442-20131203/5977_1 /TAXON_ID= /ORGANISM="Craspedostauros australis, Strain CCMP3328" /LENGTH=125 /DNA_ID=CAMNT_0043772021 /DNA_START=739 /DNA_END=1116 /DNA_ORIENTATION=+